MTSTPRSLVSLSLEIADAIVVAVIEACGIGLVDDDLFLPSLCVFCLSYPANKDIPDGR